MITAFFPSSRRRPLLHCEGQSLPTYSALDQKELVAIIDVDSNQPIIQVKSNYLQAKKQQQ